MERRDVKARVHIIPPHLEGGERGDHGVFPRGWYLRNLKINFYRVRRRTRHHKRQTFESLNVTGCVYDGQVQVCFPDFRQPLTTTHAIESGTWMRIFLEWNDWMTFQENLLMLLGTVLDLRTDDAFKWFFIDDTSFNFRYSRSSNGNKISTKTLPFVCALYRFLFFYYFYF